MKAPNNISYGVSWIKGEIEIEVYSVCRQRLLQGGSTNYNTYDFETSQNLIIGTFDRTPVTYEIKNWTWTGPTWHMTENNLFLKKE